MKTRLLAPLGLAALALAPVWLEFAPALLASGASAPLEQERPAPFRTRVQAFWKWFGERAEDHRTALLSGDAAKTRAAGDELGRRLAELVPGLTLRVEPGGADGSVRIELAPGDERTRQLLGRELAASKPALAGWDCVVWRPPWDATRPLGQLGDTPLSLADFRAFCEWDGEAPRLSLAIWHDGLPRLSDADRTRLATQFVERALGETMLKRTPHAVTVLEAAPEAEAEGVIAGDELYATLAEFLASENFDATTPPELRADYYGPPSGEHAADTRLGDLASGASRYTDLIADYNLDLGTSTLDQLATLGAGAAFIGLTHTVEHAPLDVEGGLAVIALREKVAQELDAALLASHTGTVVGWGDGFAREWLDVLFFDEAAALPIVRTVLAAEARITAAELYAFDRARPAPLAKLK